jgi:hypothetical protein
MSRVYEDDLSEENDEDVPVKKVRKEPEEMDAVGDLIEHDSDDDDDDDWKRKKNHIEQVVIASPQEPMINEPFPSLNPDLIESLDHDSDAMSDMVRVLKWPHLTSSHGKGALMRKLSKLENMWGLSPPFNFREVAYPPEDDREGEGNAEEIAQDKIMLYPKPADISAFHIACDRFCLLEGFERKAQPNRDVALAQVKILASQNVNKIERIYCGMMRYLTVFRQYLLVKNLITASFCPEFQILVTDHRLRHICHKVVNSYVAIRALHFMEVQQDGTVPSIPWELETYNVIRPSVDKATPSVKMTSTQRRALECLMKTYRANYRRKGSDLYQEIKCGKFDTQAWQRVSSIKDFVYRIDGPISGDINRCLDGMSGKAGLQSVIDIIENINLQHEGILLTLRPDRMQWSFKNGIYTAWNNMFWSYGRHYDDPMCPFQTRRASVQFINEPFPEEEWEKLKSAPLTRESLLAVPVESVDHIFNYQKLSDEMILFTYGMLGRMFRNVNGCTEEPADGWQMVMWFFGSAGSGKSTVIKALSEIYPSTEVGVLSNNMEDTFGLQDLYDKLVVVAPDVKQNFKLDEALFQSMASGEETSIARKNRGVHKTTWNAPLLLASNDLPRWGGQRGSITRRVFGVYFEYQVKSNHIDPNLSNTIKRNIPLLILKANAAYLFLRDQFKSKTFLNFLPQESRKFGMEMCRANNIVVEYMGDVYDMNPKEKVPMEKFKEDFKRWCVLKGKRENGFLDDNSIQSSLQNLRNDDLCIRKEGPRNSKFIHGITPKPADN